MPADPAAPPPAPAPFRPARPVVIGIVGGIAAGKSAVAQAFADHGLVRIDADAHAREISQHAAVLAELRAAFGAEIAPGGQLDRQALAQRVFADAGARARLEAILHPRIRAAITHALGQARTAGRSALLDVPLLLEGGLVAHCDHVVFVDASSATRAARARARGWADGELARREAAQAPLAEKRARADFVVDNDADLPSMQAQVAAILARLGTAP